MAEDRNDRFSELHDEENQAQEGQPQNECSADAHPARLRALMLWKLIGQDRDENEIVDSQHDLHSDKRRQRGDIGGV